MSGRGAGDPPHRAEHKGHKERAAALEPAVSHDWWCARTDAITHSEPRFEEIALKGVEEDSSLEEANDGSAQEEPPDRHNDLGTHLDEETWMSSTVS